MVEQTAPYGRVVWWCVNMPSMFLTSRDWLTATRSFKYPDGTWYIAARSVDHPKKPETSTYVRATVFCGGWKLQPLEGDPNKTMATYVAHIDLSGSIPTTVMNMAANNIPQKVAKVRYFMANKDNTPYYKEWKAGRKATLALFGIEDSMFDDDSESDTESDDSMSLSYRERAKTSTPSKLSGASATPPRGKQSVDTRGSTAGKSILMDDATPGGGDIRMNASYITRANMECAQLLSIASQYTGRNSMWIKQGMEGGVQIYRGRDNTGDSYCRYMGKGLVGRDASTLFE